MIISKVYQEQTVNNIAIVTEDMELFAKIVTANLECNVYLVGSALIKPNPRDIDIRAIMPIPQFKKLFGPIPQYLEESETGLWTKNCKIKWSDKCRLFFYISSAINIKNLDFQICYEGQYNEPKLLLSKFQTLKK